MHNFIYSIPTKVYFGSGQIDNLPAITKHYGTRILLVYGGGSIKKAAYMTKSSLSFKEN